MAQYDDILLDSNESLQATTDGDFVVGDASNQLMYYIIVSSTGNWKEFPLVGVGMVKYLNSDISRFEIEQIIKGQLRTDVFHRASVDASTFEVDGKVTVNKTTFEISEQDS